MSSLNKADEELRQKIEKVELGELSDGMPAYLESNEVDTIMQAIKQRDAIRDKAKQLEGLKALKEQVLDTHYIHLIDDPVFEIQKFVDSYIAAVESQTGTPTPIPGFGNTMSDLDKLTIKPASEEERA